MMKTQPTQITRRPETLGQLVKRYEQYVHGDLTFEEVRKEDEKAVPEPRVPTSASSK